jgi:hypothetical protein
VSGGRLGGSLLPGESGLDVRRKVARHGSRTVVQIISFLQNERKRSLTHQFFYKICDFLHQSL